MLGANQYGQSEFGAPAGLTVTATCATDSATIYLTVNGTRPTPTNYVASGVSPVSVVTFGGAKARAYKTGLRASEIAEL